MIGNVTAITCFKSKIMLGFGPSQMSVGGTPSGPTEVGCTSLLGSKPLEELGLEVEGTDRMLGGVLLVACLDIQIC